MPPKQSKKKKPAAPARPFPWVCRECGAKNVEEATIPYEIDVRHDGRTHSLTLDALRVPVCGRCNAKVFTEDTDRQINDALRLHVGLLTPNQIRDGLSRIGATQTQASKLLGIAKETLSRWINGVQIQSKSMDTLLRLYFAIPVAREALESRKQNPELGLSDLVDTAPRDRYVRPVRRSSATSKGWNGERDKCKSAQAIVQKYNSTWPCPVPAA